MPPLTRQAIARQSAQVSRAGTSRSLGERYDPQRRFIRERPAQPAPAAAPAITQAPPNPFAFAEGFTNIEQYSASIRRQTADGTLPPGPNPLQDIQAQQHPQGGPGSLVDPFNPQGQPITRQQFDNLKSQFALIHQPTTQAAGREFSQRVLAGMAGGEGHAPTPVRQLLTGNAPAVDDVVISNPESVDPGVLAKHKENLRRIRKDFADMLTRNRGDLTLDDFMDMGDILSARYPDNPRSIKNLMQNHIRRDAGLSAEFDQFRLTGGSPSTGNALFQQLEPGQQERFRAMIEAASDPSTGFIHPELAEALGFQPDTGLGGGFSTTKPGGEIVPATAADVAARGRAFFGLEGDVQPLAPPPQQGTTGAIGEEGIAGLTGITGVVEGPRGKVLSIIGGATIEAEDVPQFIQDLLTPTATRQVTDRDRTAAKNIADALGVKVDIPEAPEIETPEQAQASLNEIDTSPAQAQNLIRRKENGDTMFWNPSSKKWQLLIRKQERELIFNRENLKPAGIKLLQKGVAKLGEISEVIERGSKVWIKRQRKAAAEAWQQEQ